MIKVKINGQQHNWDGYPDLPLLWFLRDETGLTGTKYGCGQALCGACTVIVDKQAVRRFDDNCLAYVTASALLTKYNSWPMPRFCQTCGRKYRTRCGGRSAKRGLLNNSQ